MGCTSGRRRPAPPASLAAPARTARRRAGTLLVPVRREQVGGPEQRAGADLLADVPALAALARALAGPLVLGNYVYADGGTNVRVSVAVDALTPRLQDVRTTWRWRSSPPRPTCSPSRARRWPQSDAAYEAGRHARAARPPLRTRQRRPAAAPGLPPRRRPGHQRRLVPQQGPNYALAKRLQRWRAVVARAAGATVSLNVAPPTRTRSVVKNRALAAAYAGRPPLRRRGLRAGHHQRADGRAARARPAHRRRPAHAHPWQDEAYGAVHGGLWRSAYAPRSALGLAALLGYGASRS